MYVRFTPKQLNLLKRILPTCQLRAMDIQIFQEIMKALENTLPEDDQFKNNNKKKMNKRPDQKVGDNNFQKNNRNNFNIKSEPFEDSNCEPVSETSDQEEMSTNPYYKDNESSSNIEEETQDNSIVEEEPEQVNQEEETVPNVFPKKDIDEDDAPTQDELDNAGPFDVIDRRKNKGNSKFNEFKDDGY